MESKTVTMFGNFAVLCRALLQLDIFAVIPVYFAVFCDCFQLIYVSVDGY